MIPRLPSGTDLPPFRGLDMLVGSSTSSCLFTAGLIRTPPTFQPMPRSELIWKSFLMGI